MGYRMPGKESREHLLQTSTAHQPDILMACQAEYRLMLL